MRVVRARGGRDQEDQVRRAVRGAEVHPGGGPSEGQGRGRDVGAAAVRDAYPALQAGRHLGLARRHVRQEAVQVRDPAEGHHPFGEGTCRPLSGIGGQVEVDQFGQ